MVVGEQDSRGTVMEHSTVVSRSFLILGRIGQSFVVLLQVGWRVTPAAFHKDQKGLLQHPKRLRI